MSICLQPDGFFYHMSELPDAPVLLGTVYIRLHSSPAGLMLRVVSKQMSNFGNPRVFLTIPRYVLLFICQLQDWLMYLSQNPHSDHWNRSWYSLCVRFFGPLVCLNTDLLFMQFCIVFCLTSLYSWAISYFPFLNWSLQYIGITSVDKRFLWAAVIAVSSALLCNMGLLVCDRAIVWLGFLVRFPILFVIPMLNNIVSQHCL